MKYTLNDIEKAILEINKLKINEKIKEDLFDRLIWRISEINGNKYKNSDYISERADKEKNQRNLRLDHIFPRKSLKTKLVKNENLVIKKKKA